MVTFKPSPLSSGKAGTVCCHWSITISRKRVRLYRLKGNVGEAACRMKWAERTRRSEAESFLKESWHRKHKLRIYNRISPLRRGNPGVRGIEGFSDRGVIIHAAPKSFLLTNDKVV
jgi:hypothetical protein